MSACELRPAGTGGSDCTSDDNDTEVRVAEEIFRHFGLASGLYLAGLVEDLLVCCWSSSLLKSVVFTSDVYVARSALVFASSMVSAICKRTQCD